MDTTVILGFLQELAYFLIVFSVFLMYAIIRGRQAVINLVVGLYFALLISLVFPYYDTVLGSASGPHSEAIGTLVLFIAFALISTILMSRLMPDEYQEKKFESFGKKILLALGGTVLIMAFSFNVLPVTEFLTPGTPIQTLFAAKEYFFWWLCLPLVFLYIN